MSPGESAAGERPADAPGAASPAAARSSSDATPGRTGPPVGISTTSCRSGSAAVGPRSQPGAMSSSMATWSSPANPVIVTSVRQRDWAST